MNKVAALVIASFILTAATLSIHQRNQPPDQIPQTWWLSPTHAGEQIEPCESPGYWNDCDPDVMRASEVARRMRLRQFASRMAVQREVGYKFRLPDPGIVPPLEGIFLNPDVPILGQPVQVSYGDVVDGIHFVAAPEPVTVEAQIVENYGKPPVRRTGPFSSKKRTYLPINGHPGSGIEPLERGGGMHTPGLVHWHVKGVDYLIIGARGERPTPLTQLIAIASTIP